MLLDKTYVVTGASSGIGKAIAAMLLEQNAKVIGVGRNVREIAGQPNFDPRIIDFEKTKNYEQAIKTLVSDLSSIDGCINAAGIGRFGGIEQFSFAQMQSMMNINFMAHALLARHILPILKQQKIGDMIFIGSEAAVNAGKNGAMYCATKFAIRGLALSLREECSKSGVRVSLINPGMVKTPFFDKLSFAPAEHEENYLLPEDIANTVKLILTSRQGTVFDEINLSPKSHVINFGVGPG